MWLNFIEIAIKDIQLVLSKGLQREFYSLTLLSHKVLYTRILLDENTFVAHAILLNKKKSTYTKVFSEIFDETMPLEGAPYCIETSVYDSQTQLSLVDNINLNQICHIQPISAYILQILNFRTMVIRRFPNKKRNGTNASVLKPNLRAQSQSVLKSDRR